MVSRVLAYVLFFSRLVCTKIFVKYFSQSDIATHYYVITSSLSYLNRVNPETQLGATALDHLYQPSGYKTRSGYTIVGNNCEHGNSVFLNSGAGNRGSFNIAPDWASERKKSIVVRN